MASSAAPGTSSEQREVRKPRLALAILGPGLVVAATGVGAGDLVSSVTAGASYGMTFAWAILLGALLKFGVTESIGRWFLATGRSPLRGFHSLGRWVTAYFGFYTIVLGFFYGAAITAASGLALNAMLPVLPVTAWSVISGVVGLGVLLACHQLHG